MGLGTVEAWALSSLGVPTLDRGELVAVATRLARSSELRRGFRVPPCVAARIVGGVGVGSCCGCCGPAVATPPAVVGRLFPNRWKEVRRPPLPLMLRMSADIVVVVVVVVVEDVAI